MKLILIAAMAKNRVIGNNNSIPWCIPEEMAHFKKNTMGHALIMGRKTFESIGDPLPGRRNVVLSRDSQYSFSGCRMAPDLSAAITLCGTQEKIFIIGGGSLYAEAIHRVDTICLSVIDKEYKGDTFFPVIPQTLFKQVSIKKINSSPAFTILTFERKQEASPKSTP